MNILFIGDIFGKVGRQIILDYLPSLKEEFKVDLCIANGENLAHGRGVTEKTARPLFEAGIDIFTSGNHLWDKKEAFVYLKQENRILKPINYPKRAIGNYYQIWQDKEDNKVAIFCLVGQAFMGPAGNLADSVDKLLPTLQKQTNTIIVDIHAEATAEKRTLGFYLQGKVSAVIGTHTHIQTADEEILPEGTAYITDVGMTGPHDSVIGIKKDIILRRFISGMPVQYEIADSGLQINAILVRTDDKTGKAVEIFRIRRKIDDPDS